MKKKHILSAFVGLGSMLVLFQFLLLWFLSDYAEEKGVVLEDVEILLSVASTFQLPVVLVDPLVLQSLAKGSSVVQRDLCAYLCEAHNVLTFATLYSFLTQKERFIPALSNQGFNVVQFQGLNSMKADILEVELLPIGYFLKRSGAILQLILFHEREGNFWWHGSFESDFMFAEKFESLGVNMQNIHIGLHEGAYDKFECQKTVVDGIKLQVPTNMSGFLSQMKKSEFMECNQILARRFKERFGQDVSSDATKFRHKAWKLLAKARTLLDGLGVRFWLSSGTCLGYFRECDIIPYAKDVDLGVWIKDYDVRIVPEFTSHGLALKHWFGRVNDSLEFSFQEGDIKLDIFFFYKEDDTYWNGGTQAKSGKKFKYVFPKFTLCWTEFLELKVRVPCETRSYIEANYGLNWFEPVKDWDWKSSPGNVRENGQWPESDWPQVIQVYNV